VFIGHTTRQFPSWLRASYDDCQVPKQLQQNVKVARICTPLLVMSASVSVCLCVYASPLSEETISGNSLTGFIGKLDRHLSDVRRFK